MQTGAVSGSYECKVQQDRDITTTVDHRALNARLGITSTGQARKQFWHVYGGCRRSQPAKQAIVAIQSSEAEGHLRKSATRTEQTTSPSAGRTVSALHLLLFRLRSGRRRRRADTAFRIDSCSEDGGRVGSSQDSACEMKLGEVDSSFFVVVGVDVDRLTTAPTRRASPGRHDFQLRQPSTTPCSSRFVIFSVLIFKL